MCACPTPHTPRDALSTARLSRAPSLTPAAPVWATASIHAKGDGQLRPPHAGDLIVIPKGP